MHPPDSAIPTSIEAYKPVTDILAPFIPQILAGRHLITAEHSYYSPTRIRPDLDATLAQFAAGPLMPIALEQNLYLISSTVTNGAAKAMGKLLGGAWEAGGAFLYPAHNGFMDWHTNHDQPGVRIYFVWCEQGNTSRFMVSPDGGRTITAPYEPAGWAVNVFRAGDEKSPLWHAISSGSTHRLSFGFRHRTNTPQNILKRSPGLFSGDA